MTQILFGERELLIRAIGDVQLIIPEDEGLTTGIALATRWQQRTLKPRPIAVLNPPDPTKRFVPITGHFVLFDKAKVPAAWLRWAQTHKIVPVEKSFPTEGQMVAYLTGGSVGVTFTTEAAEWYTRVIGTSPMRMSNEVRKLLLLGRESVTLDELLDLIAIQEDVKAERILRSLGTKRSLKLAQEVPEDRAIPLIAYLDRALEHRKDGWWLMLKTIRIGADRLQYSYWAGVQVFVHACYKGEKGDKLSLALQLLSAASMVK